MKTIAKDVSQDDALAHVLGYTCFNDVTERTLAGVPGQLIRAKGFDTFAAFGPCIAEAGTLDPFNLVVRTYLNGRKVQEGFTKDLVFSVPYLIHYISQCMTLYPGDIISTGTPQGVDTLLPGDVVELEVEHIGRLKNPVVAES